MLLLKYLLMFTGIGMLLGAAGILAWDLYRILKSREPGESKPVRCPISPINPFNRSRPKRFSISWRPAPGCDRFETVCWTAAGPLVCCC